MHCSFLNKLPATIIYTFYSMCAMLSNKLSDVLSQGCIVSTQILPKLTGIAFRNVCHGVCVLGSLKLLMVNAICLCFVQVSHLSVIFFTFLGMVPIPVQLGKIVLFSLQFGKKEHLKICMKTQTGNVKHQYHDQKRLSYQI